MRTLIGFCVAVLLAVSLPLSAQNGGAFINATPAIRGSFGNVLFPGGTSATTPGTVRSFGNVVFPGGGGPQPNALPVRTGGFVGRPGGVGRGFGGRGFGGGFGRGFGGSNRATVVAVPYAVPVYGGGFYDNPYLPADGGVPQEQPNVTVVYPPQPAPVIINQFGPSPDQSASEPATAVYQPQEQAPGQGQQAAGTSEPTRYLIAFKDHTIYSAVAYWVDGDTLHYFTSPSTHNQVSLSLVDKPLTERLNKESGIDMRLP